MDPLAPYQHLDAIHEEMEGWTAAHEGLVETRRIGTSTGGLPITAARIGRDPSAPVLSLTALFHSMEFVGTATVMAFVRRILEDTANPLLDTTNVCVVPVVHPDGYTEVWDKLTAGKKWFLARYTKNGVNLNRNFGPGFHNRRKRSPKSGPEPLSEPEAKALKAWHDDYPPRLSMAFHTSAHYLVHPWSYHHGPPPEEDMQVYRRLYDLFSEPMQRPFRFLQSSHFNGHTGDYKDWVYGDYKAASFLIEMGRPVVSVNLLNFLLDPFTFFNYPHPRGLQKDIHNVVAGLLNWWEVLPELAPMTIEGYPEAVDYRQSLLL